MSPIESGIELCSEIFALQFIQVMETKVKLENYFGIVFNMYR